MHVRIALLVFLICPIQQINSNNDGIEVGCPKPVHPVRDAPICVANAGRIIGNVKYLCAYDGQDRQLIVVQAWSVIERFIGNLFQSSQGYEMVNVWLQQHVTLNTLLANRTLTTDVLNITRDVKHGLEFMLDHHRAQSDPNAKSMIIVLDYSNNSCVEECESVIDRLCEENTNVIYMSLLDMVDTVSSLFAKNQPKNLTSLFNNLANCICHRITSASECWATTTTKAPLRPSTLTATTTVATAPTFPAPATIRTPRPRPTSPGRIISTQPPSADKESSGSDNTVIILLSVGVMLAVVFCIVGAIIFKRRHQAQQRNMLETASQGSSKRLPVSPAPGRLAVKKKLPSGIGPVSKVQRKMASPSSRTTSMSVDLAKTKSARSKSASLTFD